MTRHLIPLLALLALLAFTACADNAPTALPATTLTITFDTHAARASRTALVSSDNVQHVRRVQLYIFNGTTSDAVCLRSIDAGWAQPVGPTAEQTMTLPADGLTADGTTAYTFLAVGMDDGSATAYGLPEAITPGTTLGDAVARLADGRTADAMAAAELFAGSATAVLQPNAANAVGIDLYRRVAGVQVYVTDIPDGTTAIRLRADADQHREVPLMRQADAADGTFLDYGTARLDGSCVLLDLPVDSVARKGGLLSGTSLVKQDGTVMKGAYVLPLEAPADASACTLQLEVWKGDVLYRTFRVTLRKGDTVVSAYPLRANCFYTIGTLNTTENDPQSLGEAETDIRIEVEPNFEKDHDYDIQ